MYAFTCLVERAWRFGLPLVLVDIPGQNSYKIALHCSIAQGRQHQEKNQVPAKDNDLLHIET